MGSMVSSILWVIHDLDHQPYYLLGLGSQSHNKDGLLGSNSMRVVYIWNLWNSAAEVKLGGIRKRRWFFLSLAAETRQDSRTQEYTLPHTTDDTIVHGIPVYPAECCWSQNQNLKLK